MKTLRERAIEAAKRQLSSDKHSILNQSWRSIKGLPLLTPTLPTEAVARVNIRILPYVTTDLRNNPDCEEKGVQWFKRRYWVHRVGEENLRVCCLFRTFGVPCPVCRVRSRLRAQGADEETLKKYNTSERELYNVYDYASKTVKLMDQSTFFFGKKLLLEVNDPVNDTAYNYVMPDENGVYLSCRFDQSTFKTAVTLGSVKFVNCKNAVPQSILDQCEDLDAILIEKTATELEALLEGAEDALSEDTAGGATPTDSSKPTEKAAGTAEVGDGAVDNIDDDEELPF